MRVAIIGCGEEGARFAHAVQRYGWEVAVCADVDERRAKRLAKPFDATPSTRCNAVIGQKKIDAVIVASPTPSHAGYVERAANARKPVLCAAPFSLDPKAASKALAAVKKSKTPYHIAYAGRGKAAYQALDNLYRVAGPAVRVHRTCPMPQGVGNWYRDYAQSGGAIACELASAIDWSVGTGGHVTRVYAQNLRLPTMDYALVTLTLQYDHVVQLIGSWSAPKGTAAREMVELCGSGGMLRYDSADSTLQFHSRGSAHLAENPSVQTDADRHVARLAKAIDDGPPDAKGLRQDRNVVQTIDAAIRSGATGKAIRVAKEITL